MDIEDILESTERAVEFAFKAIRYAIENPDIYKDPKSKHQYDLSMAVYRQASKNYELVFEDQEQIRLIDRRA